MSMATGAGMNRMTGGKDIIPKGYRKGQITQYTPEQMGLFGALFSHLGPDSFINRLASGDQSMFEQLEAPALKQFGELQGNIASRFSGMGSGARRSSGFQNTMNQASSDFAQALQSQRLQLRNQALQDLFGMSEKLLGQRPYEKTLIKKQTPFWQQLLLGINERGQELAGSAAKYAMGGG